MNIRSVVSVSCAISLFSMPGLISAQAQGVKDGSPAPVEAQTSAPADDVPAGFSDTVVANVTQPTGLAFTPDGRMLVISKPGELRVVDDAGQAPVVLDLKPRVCSVKELGLVGLAVDPQFATNHFIYLYYTDHGGGTCTDQGGTRLENRVGRFVLGDDNNVSMASEKVIVDHIESPAANHIAGDLEFGADGYLYISVGDGGCSIGGNGDCGPLNTNSQRMNLPQGKILRVSRNGLPAATNPFISAAGARRCTNPAGVSAGTGPCKEIFASGFRNPFRFARKPGTNSFYVNDVGLHTWEEINRLAKGRNYGWNVREGHCVRDSATNCGPAAPYTNPIFDYQHTPDCRSITGGAFVPKGLWPDFDGAYLFADYACGKIWRLDQLRGGGFERSRFMTGLGGPVHLQFGPYGDTKALYYLAMNTSTVHRVAEADANTAPVARFSYTPNGTNVTFDGAASSDPDSGDSVQQWTWDFGDGGAPLTTNDPTVTHNYATEGEFDVSLTVRDESGLASVPTTKAVHSGEHLPTIAITSPRLTDRFRVGQEVTVSAEASDVEGQDQLSEVSWTVERRHANHTHPFMSGESGSSISLTYPAPEDLAAAADSELIAYATVTDSSGLSATASQALRPRKVILRFATTPEGGRVVVGGQRLRTPAAVTSWAHHRVPVRAPDQRIGGVPHVFRSWSDGKPRNHTITTPFEHTKYVAAFRRR